MQNMYIKFYIQNCYAKLLPFYSEIKGNDKKSNISKIFNVL